MVEIYHQKFAKFDDSPQKRMIPIERISVQNATEDQRVQSVLTHYPNGVDSLRFEAQQCVLCPLDLLS